MLRPHSAVSRAKFCSLFLNKFLVVLRGPSNMSGTELELATSKSRILPSVLSLWSQKIPFFYWPKVISKKKKIELGGRSVIPDIICPQNLVSSSNSGNSNTIYHVPSPCDWVIGTNYRPCLLGLSHHCLLNCLYAPQNKYSTTYSWKMIFQLL